MEKKEINGLSQSILESVSSQLLDVSKRVDGDIQKAMDFLRKSGIEFSFTRGIFETL